MPRLFVSPHLDDAVLSCGALIATFADQGRDTIVATVFAGYPPPGELGPAARQLHREWDLIDDPVGTRRDEDTAALRVLGARPLHLDLPDCIYRTENGRPLMRLVSEVFATPATPELRTTVAATLDQLMNDIRPSAIYLPLGIGGHLDHRAVATAGHRLADRHRTSVAFYEDMPYAARMPAAIDGLLFAGELRPSVNVVSCDAWRRKLEAVSHYRSQRATLSNPPDTIDSELASYARHMHVRRFSERLWLPSAS